MPAARALDPGASSAACLGALLRRLRTLQGLSQAGLGRLTGYDGSYVGAVERAAVRPSRELIERCDHALAADGVLLALWSLTTAAGPAVSQAAAGPATSPPAGGPGASAGAEVPDNGGSDGLAPDGGRARGARPVPPDRPPRDGVGALVEAMEVARQAEASEAGPGTLEEIERALERLREAAARTPPELLIPVVRGRRRYVGRLLAGRLTLGHRRRLLVAAGWLSALLAELYFDAGEREAAEANRDAAYRLAEQAGHAELAARAVGSLASWARADGRLREAAELARAGPDLAPPASAAALQLALDEAQAWASLGDRRRAAAARHQAALTRAMLPGAIPAGAGPVPTPASGHDAQAPPPAGLDLAGAAAS
ncbi:MAG TPA: helix-turn-helix transcriptional regulator [Actinomycetota bacterium]|nr:helix-turn-helix transcriptional regulator [Actinomycetota bacterium]